jgi:triosephosphate isomerase
LRKVRSVADFSGYRTILCSEEQEDEQEEDKTKVTDEM